MKINLKNCRVQYCHLEESLMISLKLFCCIPEGTWLMVYQQNDAAQYRNDFPHRICISNYMRLNSETK